MSRRFQVGTAVHALKHLMCGVLLSISATVRSEATLTALHTGEVAFGVSVLESVDPPDGISDDVRWLLRSIINSGDARGHPFAVIDKKLAALHVFDSTGQWAGTTPVLLGSAMGDHTVPGVGDKAIKDVLPHERTTPAGRFVAETGRNARNEEVIWIDYDAGVSIHPVLTTNPSERRVERLQSPTAADNRMSYGCVNVPTLFYGRTLLPMLRKGGAVIYVLPEVQRVDQVFDRIVS